MHIQFTIFYEHIDINLGVWYRWVATHVFLGMNLCKIYARSHKMSFIHVHILQRPKAIYVYGYKTVEEPVKAKKCTISSIYLMLANIEGTLINAWVESYESDLNG